MKGVMLGGAGERVKGINAARAGAGAQSLVLDHTDIASGAKENGARIGDELDSLALEWWAVFQPHDAKAQGLELRQPDVLPQERVHELPCLAHERRPRNAQPQDVGGILPERQSPPVHVVLGPMTK